MVERSSTLRVRRHTPDSKTPTRLEPPPKSRLRGLRRDTQHRRPHASSQPSQRLQVLLVTRTDQMASRRWARSQTHLPPTLQSYYRSSMARDSTWSCSQTITTWSIRRSRLICLLSTNRFHERGTEATHDQQNTRPHSSF